MNFHIADKEWKFIYHFNGLYRVSRSEIIEMYHLNAFILPGFKVCNSQMLQLNGRFNDSGGFLQTIGLVTSKALVYSLKQTCFKFAWLLCSLIMQNFAK